MPISVCKKATANASALQHVKSGLHNVDIFGNEDGRSHLTCGIASVTNHEGEVPTIKLPCTGLLIATEGEISLEDVAKPGEISVLEPGNVARVDKGTTFKVSSTTAGKVYYINQIEFGTDGKTHLV